MMLRKLKVLILVFLPLLSMASQLVDQVKTEAPDLYTVQQELIQYHDKGEYEREIEAVIQQAKKQLEMMSQQKRPQAIVLDIDETALSNWSTLQQNQFHYDKAKWLAWEKEEKATPIKPVLALYHYALAHNITIFFITGRDESTRQETANNLKKAGYDQYKALYLRTNQYGNTVEYKTAMRKKITEQGYDIVMSIGDQYSDLCGGYAQVLVKLSNPFYYVPGCSAESLSYLQQSYSK